MRVVLRLLIALNWTVAGFSCYQLIYGHDYNWWSACIDLAREDMRQQHPDLVFGEQEYNQREVQLAHAYHRRTEPIAQRGFLGWVVMMGVGTVTAIALIAVFRRLPKPPPN